MRVPKHRNDADSTGAPHGCTGQLCMAISPQSISEEVVLVGTCGDARRDGSPENDTEDPGAPDHCRGHAPHDHAFIHIHTTSGLQRGHYHGAIHCTYRIPVHAIQSLNLANFAQGVSSVEQILAGHCHAFLMMTHAGAKSS